MEVPGTIMSLISRLKKEFSDPENMKDAERGVAMGLIVGTILAAFITTSDFLALNFDYIRNQNPYGVLWTWLNPMFWTDVPYRIYTTAFLFAAEAIQWYFFVRTHKMSKFLFYAGWFQSMIWMRGSVFQNVTVTAFAPLGSLFPWLIIPFMLLQKIPLGWSWNGSDAHWWCAFTGNSGFTSGDTITFPNGQQLISCPGGWLRWNPSYSWFWSYAMIMFWLIMPLLFYLKKRNRGKFVTYGAEETEQPQLAQAIWNGDSWIFLDKNWICTFCGEWKELLSERSFWFDDRFFCKECYDQLDSCPGCSMETMYCVCGLEEIGDVETQDQCAKDIAVDRAQANLFKSGLWE